MKYVRNIIAIIAIGVICYNVYNLFIANKKVDSKTAEYFKVEAINILEAAESLFNVEKLKNDYIKRCYTLEDLYSQNYINMIKENYKGLVEIYYNKETKEISSKIWLATDEIFIEAQDKNTLSQENYLPVRITREVTLGCEEQK